MSRPNSGGVAADFHDAQLENQTSDRLRIGGNLLVTNSSIDCESFISGLSSPLMNVPSVIRIRNCLHQKRFPFDFSGAIDCVTKSQYLLDSISSTCTFRFSSVFLSCFSFLYLSKKKIHNFRSPETQTESKSGKIQMKTNSLHTITGLRT